VSGKNVETIRKGLEAFNRRDVAGIMETCDPDAEFVPLRAILEGVTYKGEEGLRKFFADVNEEWSELSIEAPEFREVGDCVIVLGRFKARGRASGVEVDSPAAWVCDMRAGKLVRLRAYTDQQEAVAAAKLTV
jgi:ketosteroid isomerase-like protein